MIAVAHSADCSPLGHLRMVYYGSVVNRQTQEKISLKIDTNKERGRAGLCLAIAYFGANGYTVSLPINDTQY